MSPPTDGLAGIRFGTTTSPARPRTYCARGASAHRELRESIDAGNAGRHVTPIRGVPVAAVRRSPRRPVSSAWLEREGFGAHVRDAAEAFVTMVEHPRLSGGVSIARGDARAVLDAVGLDRLRAAGAAHALLAVRRRLAFVLRESLRDGIDRLTIPGRRRTTCGTSSVASTCVTAFVPRSRTRIACRLVRSIEAAR